MSLIVERLRCVVMGTRAAALLGAALILVGTVICIQVSRPRGEDFGHFYATARAIVEGRNIYALPVEQYPALYRAYMGYSHPTPWGIFYLPSAGLSLLPFTLLPFAVAKPLWFLFMWSVLLIGVYRLTLYFSPTMHRSHRLLILGLVMCSSAVRWGFVDLQMAPAILGLLGLYLEPGNRCRRWLPFLIVAWVACIKITLALPFLGVALLQRRFALVMGVLAVFVLANAVGFNHMGGLEAMRGYQRNMAVFETVNNNPNPYVVESVTRLDWPYLLNAFSPMPERSHRIGAILSLLSVCLVAWPALIRRREGTEASAIGVYLGPIVCVSLLIVYHHHYDFVLMFAPAIAYACGPAELRQAPGSRLFVLLVLLYGGLYQVGNVERLAFRVGPMALAAVKTLGVTVTVLAFLASLVALWHYLSARRLGVQVGRSAEEYAPAGGS